MCEDTVPENVKNMNVKLLKTFMSATNMLQWDSVAWAGWLCVCYSGVTQPQGNETWPGNMPLPV